jgi:hypothetical protein
MALGDERCGQLAALKNKGDARANLARFIDLVCEDE